MATGYQITCFQKLIVKGCDRLHDLIKAALGKDINAVKV